MTEGAGGPSGVFSRLRARGLSTRVYIVAFVVLLIGPWLLFTSVLLVRYAHAERARFEQDAREVAKQAATAVDHDMEGLIVALRTLAAANSLRRGDVGAFEQRMRALAQSSGLELTLRRRDGSLVASTALAPGAPLARSPQPFDEAVTARRAPVVSGAMPDMTPGRPPTYIVAVPIVLEGAVEYILDTRLSADRLTPLLLAEAVPGWTLRVLDREASVLADTRRDDPAARRSAASLKAAIEQPNATFAAADDRMPALFATSRVRTAGWVVAVSAPQTLVDARADRWIWAFAGFGLLTLATSTFVAMRLWMRVADPIRRLAASGDELSRGRPLPRLETPVREIRQLGDVLARATAEIQGNMEARDRALREQARGLAALKESEARFRHMADSAPALIWMTDDKAGIVFTNMHFEHVFGRKTAALAGDGWRRVTHPDDSGPFLAGFMDAFTARRPFQAEVRGIDRHGHVRWLRCESVPRLDDSQSFLGYTGCAVDITDIKAAETALRVGEERLKLALEAGQLGMWELDILTGERVLSPRSASILDTEAETTLDRSHWKSLVQAEDQAHIEAEFQALIAGARPYDVEYRITDRQGETRWIWSQAKLEGDSAAPRRMVGIHQDVTARKRAEEHQRLLIHELNHRVKNTLATVQSIVLQSLRPVRGPVADAAREALESRLIALARAHDILTRERWESAELGDVVAQAIAPHHGRGGATRFVTKGAPLRLAPRVALSIAMALHELATNAVKYGALSVPEGHVEILWSVSPAPRRLSLTWREVGGPPVAPPTRTGFGSRLVERNLARELDGMVSLRFEPSGVICEIHAPLPTDGPAPDAKADELEPTAAVAAASAPPRSTARRRRPRVVAPGVRAE